MNTHNATIGQEILTDLTGYNKSSEIAAFLAKNGVPFFRGKRGKIWTTIDAINTALGLSERKRLNEVVKNDLIEVL